MKPYTPTTADIREVYVSNRPLAGVRSQEDAEREFDRWLEDWHQASFRSGYKLGFDDAQGDDLDREI